VEMAKLGHFDVVCHGCNCFHKMGAGIAKQIAEVFPMALEADKHTRYGDKEKLGTLSTCSCFVMGGEIRVWSHVSAARLTVANAYTQFQYWGPKPRVDYNALKDCLRILGLEFSGQRIGMPKIGCGLAGGDWKKVMGLIEETLYNEDVTIVEWSAR